jgi:uncharacterized YigZ family protein
VDGNATAIPKSTHDPDLRNRLRAGSAGVYTHIMVPTLQSRCIAVLKVRDSRFVGIGIPVESEEEALRELSAIRAEYSDATHCCYAYRIGHGDMAKEKSDDAAEPAGSAGAPILSVIKGRGLGNIMVAVIRYFGGTKLGVGGLARAYRDAAKAALGAGTVQEKEVRRRLRVKIPLPLVGEARSHLARLGGEVLAETYGEAAELSLTIAEGRIHELREKLDDLSRGAALWWEGGGESA